MESFLLSQAADWTHGETTGEAQITSVVKDNREVVPGCLFAAIRGERFDGHDFIPEAVKNGAAAVLSARRDETYDAPALYVDDTRQAMLDLAGGYRDRFDCPVVAITGSVGKTTTRGMTQAVLGRLYETHATTGNLNNQLGLPLSVLGLESRHEAAVFEMGMSGFGEIASMVDCAKPSIAVITMIGTSHIEFLGSREGICRAKMEILDGLAARGGIAVLNGDEPLLWDKRDHIYGRKVWFGIENPNCDVRAGNIAATPSGVSFTIRLPEGSFPVQLSIPGEHNVGNALAAAAVGWLLGVEPDDIAAALAAYQPDGRRQKLYEKNGFTIYEDCYNASPDSMKAALKVLGSQKGRRLAALGSMLELGEHAVEGHREAGLAAAEYADAVYLYGGNAADIAAGAREGGMAAENIQIFDTHEALAAALKADARPGDALLFKGSRGMRMENAMKRFLGEEV
ncbi:MAG: UDP-N-acetylmuramoyl-tripeptide--D-alanyl-D-alanine ligase [Butyricicoccus pullicaecorum]|nr:UDP-N-acetylmuramoyl-tripeptide--D-alanyl-D-alanine ligase [Butyricicoccus pullicaecorum]